MVCYENRKYLMCNLMKDKVPQMALDLNFETGSKITFVSNGNSNVHLTGFHIQDMDDEDDFDEEDLDMVMQEATKKRKKSPENERPGKKSKTELISDNSVEDEEDDSDDEDFMDQMMEEAEDEEVSDEDVEEEAEDEEDEDDDDSDESETEKKVPVKQEQPKKDKKKKENQKQMNGNASAIEKAKEQPKGQKKTLEGGVQIEEIQVGSGAVAKKGQMAFVYYVGRLKNGKKFDSMNSGKGFKFRIGRGEVIKGWDIGVAGMKVGGKRRIVVPPSLG